jgi:hypothetical protein
MIVLLIGRGRVVYKEYHKPDVIVINSLLGPYVKEYKALLEENGVDIPWGKDMVRVMFGVAIPRHVLGVAWGMDIDNITFVEINYQNWLQLSHEQKRLVMFHELTHDVFNLEHFDIVLMNTPMPKNITKQKVDLWMQELIQYVK